MKKTKLDSIVDNIFSINPLLHKNLIKPGQIGAMVSPGFHIIMMILKEHEILSMSEIGKKLCMPKPNVTALVDKLILDELVERIYDKADRRKVNIKLTVKGHGRIEDIHMQLRKHMKKNLSILTKEEENQLLISLQNLKEILTRVFPHIKIKKN